MANQPFNFYQGTGFGTGLHAPATAIDFFTGIYLPPNIPLGGDRGFAWPATDREMDQKLTWSGISQGDNKDSVATKMSFFGYVSPMIKDSGVLYLKFASGSVVPAGAEVVFLACKWTGSPAYDNIDRPYLNITLKSGDIISGNRDVVSLGLVSSGDIISGLREVVSMGLTFWGGFQKPDIDVSAIKMVIDNITYVNATTFASYSATTGAFIKMSFDNIIYGNAE